MTWFDVTVHTSQKNMHGKPTVYLLSSFLYNIVITNLLLNENSLVRY